MDSVSNRWTAFRIDGQRFVHDSLAGKILSLRIVSLVSYRQGRPQVMKLSPELKSASDISIETLLLIQPTVDLSAPAEKPAQPAAKVVLSGEMVEVTPHPGDSPGANIWLR